MARMAQHSVPVPEPFVRPFMAMAANFTNHWPAWEAQDEVLAAYDHGRPPRPEIIGVSRVVRPFSDWVEQAAEMTSLNAMRKRMFVDWGTQFGLYPVRGLIDLRRFLYRLSIRTTPDDEDGTDGHRRGG